MHSIILVAFPDEGNNFIVNPYAGAVAQNSGLNSSGFAWVLTAQFGPPAWGGVTEVYFHYLNQYCDSPLEAYQYLKETPRAGVTGAFVMQQKAVRDRTNSIITCNKQFFCFNLVTQLFHIINHDGGIVDIAFNDIPSQGNARAILYV